VIKLNFEDLKINKETVNALKKLKIDTPTPVQKAVIPHILNGHNIMMQAKTGSGKTLAFVLPIIENLNFKKNEVLIIAPTRELAKQINRVIKSLGNKKVKSMTIYGGVSIRNQIKKLKKGVNIIVGTPGRLIDLYKRRKLDLRSIDFVVLDEADRLLDMGFFPDIRYILKKIRSNYQFILASATLEQDIRNLVKQFTNNQFKYANLSKDELTVENTEQYFYKVNLYKHKYKNFLEILKRENPKNVIIFVNTKKTVNWLYNKLKSRNNFKYKVGMITGDLSQHQREQVLKAFRDKTVNMLIATDVAARGLDISNIDYVFNYDVPKYPENYIHRIGRTSRMNKEGTAITLCLDNEYEYLCHIEGLMDKEIREKTLERQDMRRKRFPFF
jgi:ATP-dependent RNA helicase DeaD